MDQTKLLAFRDYARHTVGSEHFMYYAPFGKQPTLRLTEGVDLLAKAGAYWLLDVILSHQLAYQVRCHNFQVWTMEAVDDSAVRVSAKADAGKIELITQTVDWTDFPRDLLPFTLWLVDGVLMLPQER